MKDELNIFCKLEGINEEYLRVRARDDKKLLRLEKKRNKNKERSGRECKSLECSADEGSLLE